MCYTLYLFCLYSIHWMLYNILKCYIAPPVMPDTMRIASTEDQGMSCLRAKVCCLSCKMFLWILPVFVLAGLTSPSCVRALPQKLCIWFCSQNLQVPSGIALGRNCQMTGGGFNFDSNLNSATWSTGSKGFICSEVPKPTVWSLNSF